MANWEIIRSTLTCGRSQSIRSIRFMHPQVWHFGRLLIWILMWRLCWREISRTKNGHTKFRELKSVGGELDELKISILHLVFPIKLPLGFHSNFRSFWLRSVLRILVFHTRSEHPALHSWPAEGDEVCGESFTNWLLSLSSFFLQLPRGQNQGWKIKWTDAQMSPFWPAPFMFVYRGTTQQLQNAYFIIKVSDSRWSLFTVHWSQVYVKTSDRWYQRPSLLGTALMSLRSVTTYPLFKSMVKQLTTEEIRFNQGEVIGNIRCFTRSTGQLYISPLSF